MRIDMRNRRIDVIRGVAILLVLFHHFNIAYRLSDTSLAAAFGSELVQAVARNGNYGVTLFFVVSGYLITSNALRRWGQLSRIDAWAFYGLRIARIVPCLLLLLLIVNVLALSGVAIFQNHAATGEPVPLWHVNLASLTFTMNLLISRVGWINYPLGVLWSLSVEEVFYLTFPLLCLVLRRESLLCLFWAAIIAVGPLYRLTHQGDEAGFLYAYFASFDGIAIGCGAAVLSRRFVLAGMSTWFVQGAVVALMTFLYLWWPIAQSNVLGVTAMALGTAALLWPVQRSAPSDELRFNRLGAMVAWCGKNSYELYLFHLIPLAVLKTGFPRASVAGDEKLVLLAVFMLLSLLLAAGIARYYAEPLNRMLRQRIARPRSVPSTIA
ncbi:acyltransferase [Ralstonia sp. A12]|uniref:acyltransferase family protein n=1 Tax=Ralstonia sp. A12 TaxID=1217052 RepID=UPI0005739002|nr:acyltransferase [Ralstonia sp. A12]KHK52109.1 acyltransferase [Ralstonia sp. A12]